VKPCVVIPCFNHAGSVARVAASALEHCPVIVVDDGSTSALPPLPGCRVMRLEKNSGKGAALRAGLLAAEAEGFTHAITIDADGQHRAEDLPKFLAAATETPRALIVGVRDFYRAGAPAGRRRSNAVSTFWFRVETGVRLGDTQCGFRCYPLALTRRLQIRSERYAYELEMMVRSSWAGMLIIAVPITCSYEPQHLRQSHFRPVLDLAHITIMNIGLVLQSWIMPLALRRAWSFGERNSARRIARDFFSEHAQEPVRLAGAVGLGLFCGIAPMWGYQMLVAATLAHFLRLNKAIALVASNISIPPLAPFILYASLELGHWLFTGHGLDFSAQQITRAKVFQYLGQWCIGSITLGALVAGFGTMTTYSLARLIRHR
jgi:uncharacterized protein (DUF2062 family)